MYRDWLGNEVHHFDVPGRHARLSVVAESLVEMRPHADLPERLDDDAWDALDAMTAGGEYHDYLADSAFARATPALVDYANELGLSRDADPLTTLRELTSTMAEQFAYTPQRTRVDSPIDEALEARGGVCQDLAHIMTALARRLRIPCRYVSGHLAPNPEHPDRSAAGATHAWVEALLPDVGWTGFDPTNDTLAGPRHIVVAVGRDYEDVPPTRGVFRGESASELAVVVAVAHADQRVRLDEEAGLVTWQGPRTADAHHDAEQAQQQQ